MAERYCDIRLDVVALGDTGGLIREMGEVMLWVLCNFSWLVSCLLMWCNGRSAFCGGCLGVKCRFLSGGYGVSCLSVVEFVCLSW